MRSLKLLTLCTISPLFYFVSSASAANSIAEPLPSDQQPFQFAAMAATTYSLPPLPYEYNALEPHISEQIMRLHHTKHHQAYVTNLNAGLKSQAEANSITTQIALQPAIRFNAGGHINHSLFWQNLCPASSPNAKTSAAPQLIKRVKATWGSEEEFKKQFSKALLGIQGSGWGWLVKVEGEGPKGTELEKRLEIVTTKDQDPVVGQGRVPVFGVDMWEHAYYLQYQNGKPAYVENIWNVINWKTAEDRYLGTAEDTFKALKAGL